MSSRELAMRTADDYYSVPQKYVMGNGYITHDFISSSFKTNSANSFTVTGYQNVKRRIYLIQDGDSIRALAFGFRASDAAEIENWASEGNSALTLDIDPNEVDVRWLTPALKPTGL